MGLTTVTTSRAVIVDASSPVAGHIYDITKASQTTDSDYTVCITITYTGHFVIWMVMSCQYVTITLISINSVCMYTIWSSIFLFDSNLVRSASQRSRDGVGMNKSYKG